MRTDPWIPALAFAILVSGPSTASAYETPTHDAMTGAAFDQSLATTYLRDELLLGPTTLFLDPGVLFGLNPGRPHTARFWMRFGSVAEDDTPRYINHFYDPRYNRPLTIPDKLVFPPDKRVCPLPGTPETSLEWAKNQGNMDANRRYTWGDARRFYELGLTAETETVRSAAMARTFRTLGELVHLVQDLAQPQHTRNEPHAGLRLFPGCGAPSLYEVGVNERRGTLSLSGYPAPAFAQFLDYWFTGDGRGISEFTNRNFITQGTNFTDTEQGSHHPLYPAPTLDLTLANIIPVENLPDSGGLVGPIVFWGNQIIDQVQPHELINPFMTTFSIFDNALKTAGKEMIFSYNRYNVDAAAGILLPRATGYSAGLLNYFFRGRLDVSLIRDDENDPTTIRIKGFNRSTERLDGGVIALYADIKEPATGEVRRRRIEPIDVLPQIFSDPGDPISSGQFRLPVDAERFIVVYTGKLGLEAPIPSSPEFDFPGAVIGKVIPGGRAEGVVIDRQNNKRVFRSPQGTFDLPAPTEGISQVQWGDLDNTFVGVVSADPDSPPDQVKAFRIPRDPGSTTVPTTAQPDGSTVLTVETLKSVNFPFGVQLGTTVDWTAGGTFAEALIVSAVKNTYAWGPDPFPPHNDTYVLQSETFDVPTLESPVSQGVAFSESFPIVLDAAHYQSGGTVPKPYAWRVTEVGFDAQQRLLALVAVQLTAPTNALSHAQLKAYDPERHLAPRFPLALTSSFPISNLLSAVIDVETGQVLGTTASGNVALHTSADGYFQITQRKVTTIREGGPDPGQRVDCGDWTFESGFEDYPTVEQGSLTLPPTGPTQQTIEGWYRTDLDGLVSTSQQIVSDMGSSLAVYAVDGESHTNLAVRLVAPSTRLAGYLTNVRDGVRIRPATTANPQILLRFGRPVGVQINEGEEAVLVQWSPVNPGETRLAIPGELEVSNYTLLKATPRAALVRAEGGVFPAPTSLLVDLDRGDFQDLRADVTQDFTLLAPELLYNVNDTEFYTLGLAKTALPLPLADGPTGTQPIADFHVIVAP